MRKIENKNIKKYIRSRKTSDKIRVKLKKNIIRREEEERNCREE